MAEHRRGDLRDITHEMLSKGRELAEKNGASLTALLLGHDIKGFASKLTDQANEVWVVDDLRLKNFNAEAYQRILSSLITEYKPLLTLIGHTAFGVDLAPRLAIELGIPLTTDCLDIDFEGGVLSVIRQMYGGKVNAEALLKEAESYIVTIRPAAFEAKEGEPLGGEIVDVASSLKEDVKNKKFIEYVEPSVGDVDVTAAEIIIAIGRGIKDKDNITLVQELADALGGVLACSRPIVDKEWLPKDRQVGTSGKTVKPKLYIAMGISGAFQHVAGMKSSDLVFVVNKDAKAPFFSVADYGVINDMFKIVPALKNKIYEIKTIT